MLSNFAPGQRDDRTSLSAQQAISYRYSSASSVLQLSTMPERPMHKHLRLVHSQPRPEENDQDISIDFPGIDDVRHLIDKGREPLDAIWRPVEACFRSAYVAALFDIELFCGDWVRTRRQFQSVISSIETIRRYRGAGTPHFRKSPFPAPNPFKLTHWRDTIGESELVEEGRIPSRDFPFGDEKGLFQKLVNGPSWWRVRLAVPRAIAKSILLLDPALDQWAGDWRIEPMIGLLLKQRGYAADIGLRLREIDEELVAEM